MHDVREIFAYNFHLPDVDISEGSAVSSTISQIRGSSPSKAWNNFSAELFCIPEKVAHFHAMVSLISHIK